MIKCHFRKKNSRICHYKGYGMSHTTNLYFLRSLSDGNVCHLDDLASLVDFDEIGMGHWSRN